MGERHSTFSLHNEATYDDDKRRDPWTTNASSSSFNNLIEDVMNHWKVPGMAISVVDRHRVTSHAYGVQSLKGKEEVTTGTLFDIASMSKSFTAASMALLVQDSAAKDDEDRGKEERKDGNKAGDGKKVEWTTPVNQLMSEFQFSNEEATKNVTIEDILSHRSGLAGQEESTLGVNHKTPDTPASVMKNMRNLPFSYPTRTEYEYNNLLYTCAAHMVETLSAMPFEAVLRKRFWEPLGMKRTWLGVERLPEEEKRHAAVGYIYSQEKGEVVELPHIPEPEGIGAGSIQSSSSDVARWIHAFIYRLPPLEEDSYKELGTPRILADQPPKGLTFLSLGFYCLGWEVSWYHGYQLVKHDGAWAGFVSTMLYIPALEWGLVILTNSEDAYAANMEISFHLIDDLLSVEGGKRFGWRAHYDKVLGEEKPKTKEELFPDLDKHGDDEPREDPDLRRFAGKYWNKGYHELELVFKGDGEEACIEVDGRDRSYTFVLHIRERVYGYWYVCDHMDPGSGEKSTYKCRFEVDREGKGKRFGVDWYEETGDLIWFDKVQE